MTRILRLTRHEASKDQLSELERIYGEDVEVEILNETLPQDSREAVARFDELVSENDADVVEAVLPVNLLQALLNYSSFCHQEDGRIIRAQMDREVQEDGEAIFTFNHYEVVKKVEIVTEVL